MPGRGTVCRIRLAGTGDRRWDHAMLFALLQETTMAKGQVKVNKGNKPKLSTKEKQEKKKLKQAEKNK